MENKRVALGFDIGGTHTKIGLVSADGQIRGFKRFPTDAQGNDPQPFIDRLLIELAHTLEQMDTPVVGIGVSVHGYANEERTGPMMCFNTPALEGLDLKRILAQHFDLPVVLNNDLTAHTLAEYHFGTGRGKRRFLCLAIGTGLGAGVVINGEPLRYVGGCAGDTGHIILEPGGPACSAGCRGCAEALCGVAGIERLANRHYGKAVSAFEVIANAREGSDTIAIGIMEQIGRYLGQLLASLAPIFLPDRIALTGGTAEAGDIVLKACRDSFEDLAGGYHRAFAAVGGNYYSGTEIVLGETRGETGVLGAAAELILPVPNPHQ